MLLHYDMSWKDSVMFFLIDIFQFIKFWPSTYERAKSPFRNIGIHATPVYIMYPHPYFSCTMPKGTKYLLPQVQ